jgi:pimeloyl-ACP methyl ester carboxylesterase
MKASATANHHLRKSKQLTLLFFMVCATFLSCRKGPGIISENADDLFWISSENADMPVWVKGNTASGVIILLVQGKPGESSYGYSGSSSAMLRQKYAMAFWDMRNSGMAAGNANTAFMNLPTVGNDLALVLKVLKQRYNNPKIFLYGHGFGGFLGSAYLSGAGSEEYVTGWIEVAGHHNVPLANFLSRKKLMQTADKEIAAGNNAARWQTIKDFCLSTDSVVSDVLQAAQLHEYAIEAETLTGLGDNTFKQEFNNPSGSLYTLANIYNYENSAPALPFRRRINEATANMSPFLFRIKVPSLLIYGEKDFSAPDSLGRNAMFYLGSAEKELITFPNSGHYPMNDNPDLLQTEIMEFIEKNR